MAWNKRSEDLWGVRQDETVGRNLLSLDIGLPVSSLRQPIRGLLNNSKEHTELELQAINRRGRPLVCRMSLNRLRGTDGRTRGIILVMEDGDAMAKQASS
jgi:two-component system CheB/CheR fusion protein